MIEVPTIHKPAEVVKKAYLNTKISHEEKQRFKTQLDLLLTKLTPEKDEEHNKNTIKDFLRETYYPSVSYTINTNDKADAAIFEGANERPTVLFETKGPGKPDMVSCENINKKALHELILYYLREEIDEENHNITHLIITNGYEWFVFDKQVFYRVFAKKKSFSNEVMKADAREDSTDFIYNTIIKPYVEEVKGRLQFTYFNLREVQTKGENSRLFTAVMKLLSPQHLLKLPFQFDHNKLDRKFYDELLYILGICEVTKDGKKVLERLPASKRQDYSLMEQVYKQLGYNMEVLKDNERFEKAMGLLIVWINRILFLKLLESQLLVINKRNNQKPFLTIERINTYQVLNDLFFGVLAKPEDRREEPVKSKFSDVPYLNSSLFELNKQHEFGNLLISQIALGNIKVYSQTVLLNERGRKLTGELSSLDYLFRFLDAYDFGTVARHEEERGSKTIIDASVLGLIFEKINGYKDGSVFTPGYITEYMCRETLRKAVTDRFNKFQGLNCSDFEDLKESIKNDTKEQRVEANHNINSMKICDPAVGSGHFLVSALNELLVIKRELGILQFADSQQRRFTEYKLSVEYDELIVKNFDGDSFQYNPSDEDSLKIQKTLFEEKRTIIENCLFGVDLNPKSVEICRLRLWIELLKNAYYYYNESNKRVLQTLPNIDINIKCGNSLAAKFDVEIDKEVKGGKNFGQAISKYKEEVAAYKSCNSKDAKSELEKSIKKIKDRIASKAEPINIFGRLQAQEQEKMRKFYSHSLEWMIEFPETLDENGKFTGFDVIIGNPPYISLQEIKEDSKFYGRMRRPAKKNQIPETVYSTYTSGGDIYTLFVERGLQLLKQGGFLSYILPNKWMKVGYGEPLRQLLLDKQLTDIVDFGDNQIFGDATTYTCILSIRNESSVDEFQSATLSKVNPAKLHDDIAERTETFAKKKLTSGIWVINSINDLDNIVRLQDEMKTLGFIIGDGHYYGIKTGNTKAFNEITPEIRNSLISKDSNAQELIRPLVQGRDLASFSKLRPTINMLFIPKGFTLSGMNKSAEDKPAEEVAWEWFSENYPSVAEFLYPFKEDAKSRQDKGDYWWELRACDYYDKFEQPKIYYQAFQVKPCFLFDNSGVYCNNSMFFLSTDNKALVALLNSEVGWWLINCFCPLIQNGCQLIWDNFKQIPIPEQLPSRLSELTDEMTTAIEMNDEEKQSACMAEINSICFKLYGFIDGNNDKTKNT